MRCVELMTQGEWRTGVSHQLVASEFGVSPRTIEGWATTASRLIRLSIGDGEEVRARLVVMLEDVHRRALQKQAATSEGDMYDSPDLRSAVAAIAEQAKLLGLVEQKHRVNVDVRGYEQMPPAKMLDVIDARIAELQAARARVLAEMRSTPALPPVIDVEVIHEEDEKEGT